MNPPPASRLSRLPLWLSRWLGYRPSPPPKQPEYIVWFWSWVGAFCGLSVIMAVFGQAHYFIERNVPLLVASYGASAVLIYGAIEAPLAQPRALLFHLLPTEERFDQLRWLSAALSCSTAIVVMQITGTTHPPAGATALLPSVDDGIRQIGWYYLPVVLLSSALALAVALLLNNVQRRYPVFWFTPAAPVASKPEALESVPDQKV
ncbi:hypothetical protein EW146_g3379 [Bondarzewia mesenterica]|uniref:HPP transmembrane region domain-containing protein n=1 Tax=Bondarzewia mesenterica TaxID=1095465 RepID=A0A4S4LZJ5_9AGAM|nr:hypothetical protein EW146_g3379 [Bondarzewia mesenterica]